MEEEKVYYLENDQTGVRLDKLLSDLDPDLTRSHAEQLIEAGKVSVNGKECLKGSYKGKEGDLIRVLILRKAVRVFRGSSSEMCFFRFRSVR